MIGDRSQMVHNQSRVKLSFYRLIISWSLGTYEFTSKRLIHNYSRIRALKLFSSRSQHIRKLLLLLSCEFYICNSYSKPLRIAAPKMQVLGQIVFGL